MFGKKQGKKLFASSGVLIVIAIAALFALVSCAGTEPILIRWQRRIPAIRVRRKTRVIPTRRKTRATPVQPRTPVIPAGRKIRATPVAVAKSM